MYCDLPVSTVLLSINRRNATVEAKFLGLVESRRAWSSHFDSDNSRIRGGHLVREIGRRLRRCFDLS
jgi:hypothetical protein